ncbi:hypothetical protein M9H77_31685 [Catharanthus roseus]|uniref:Uncharacterized protein n=1 Tax=Catharanthus roseus TaxID=4058 RepID=A0ACC0A341_CATRO|nr:hypothetical protein M9H77_31685 [Catharanthus roseus]
MDNIDDLGPKFEIKEGDHIVKELNVEKEVEEREENNADDKKDREDLVKEASIDKEDINEMK